MTPSTPAAAHADVAPVDLAADPATGWLRRARRDLVLPGETAPRPWELVGLRASLVLRHEDVIVKVALPEPGSAADSQLRTGLAAAASAADRLPEHVVAPLHRTVLTSPLGPFTAWPLVDHRARTAATLTAAEATRVGVALARLAGAYPQESSPEPWAAYGVVGPRVAASSWAPPALRRLVLDLCATHGPRLADLGAVRAFAHGDVDAANVLITPTGEALLIDLDWAGYAPLGRDLGCLQHTLAVEAGNQPAWDAALDGWTSVTGHLPAGIEDLAVAKALTATSFLLVAPVAPGGLARRRRTVEARLEALHATITTGAPLGRLPGIRDC